MYRKRTHSRALRIIHVPRTAKPCTHVQVQSLNLTLVCRDNQGKLSRPPHPETVYRQYVVYRQHVCDLCIYRCNQGKLGRPPHPVGLPPLLAQ